jgi:signal transduction histidine kinase/ActR/RegA family two-component response regulator
MAVNPINAAVVSAVLWRSSARQALLVVWVVATGVVTAARVALRLRYLNAKPKSDAVNVWAARFVAGAVAAGLLWGVGSVLFYDSRELPTQLILVFVVAGMTAGAAGTLTSYLPAFFAYSGPAVLPLAFRVIAEGDQLHVGMGALVMVFGAAMTMVAISNHRSITEAFRLRFENDDLLARLTQAQASLEEANRTLEQRITQRGAALERQTEALRDAQRMESVGLLAGGVAHDFNNLLTVVMANMDLLLAESGLATDIRTSLHDVRVAAERGNALVRQLLAFSRRQVMVVRVFDLNLVVSEMHRLLSRLIGEHIEFVVDLSPAPMPIKADPLQLEQVIINLATNARDAMAGGGKLTIGTEVLELPQVGGAGAPAVPEGVYVVLTVRDTGVGMDTATRRMVFHPFFTTKEVGQGTGLGLATVYGIVEQSGGRVLVDSEPGEGSRFRVFMPRADAADIKTVSSIPPMDSGPRRAATVLLAEDEPMVRAVTARALAGAGFKVIEAEDGEQALERAREYDGVIELLVTDVVMRRMGGLDLANRLAEERPGLPVLFVSGYSRDANIVGRDAAAVEFLQKPFTVEMLIAKASQLVAVSTTRLVVGEPVNAARTGRSDKPAR